MYYKDISALVNNYNLNNTNINECLNEYANCNCELKVSDVKRLLNIVKAEKHDLERQTQGSIKSRTWTIIQIIMSIFLVFYAQVMARLITSGVKDIYFDIISIMTMILILIIAYLGAKDIVGSGNKFNLIKNIELLQYDLEDLINEENAKQDK